MKAFIYFIDGSFKETTVQSLQAQMMSAIFSGKEIAFTDISETQKYKWANDAWLSK